MSQKHGKFTYIVEENKPDSQPQVGDSNDKRQENQTNCNCGEPNILPIFTIQPGFCEKARASLKPKSICRRVKFGTCVTGIIVCFFVYGLIAEEINKCHDPNEASGKCENGKYKFAIVQSTLLTFCYWAFAQSVLTVKPDLRKDDTHVFYFMASGLLNVLSVWSSTKALESISYPTQVIAKSAKPVPIIIMCRLFRMKVYPIYKYFFVLVISIGVGLAIYKVNKSSESVFEEKHIWGIVLLLFSLLMDGGLAVVEEQLCATTAPSPLKMMAMLNGWSVVYLVVALLVYSSEACMFYEFVRRFPMVLAFLGGLAVCGTAGQVFIFMMISLFGTLPCAIATTVRKVFSTVYSAVRNGKTFDVRNWCGVALVFGAFFGELIYQKTMPSEEI